MSVIPTLERRRQEDHKFEGSLPELHETLFQNSSNNKLQRKQTMKVRAMKLQAMSKSGYPGTSHSLASLPRAGMIGMYPTLG